MPTALLSCADKSGLDDLALGLDRLGWTLLATGSTASFLRDAGCSEVTEVSDYTGSPELLGGRVKTLHPRIHAGILAPPAADYPATELIDLVICNLYPFEESLTIHGISEDELIEQIDIGGPTLLRAAAKNFARVAVVVDPADYTPVLEALTDEGEIAPAMRRFLAVKAFERVTAYDIAIAHWMRARTPGAATEELPAQLFYSLKRVMPLRYGENPHQSAALYRERGSHPVFYDGMSILQGKELSYNNLLDLAAALDLIGEYPDHPMAAIIKHGNPAGAAIGNTLLESFRRAWDTNPTAAFGSVIALGGTIDLPLATTLNENFVEVIAAAGLTDEARDLLATKKNLRVILLDAAWDRAQVSSYQLRSTPYGLLVQDWDRDRKTTREAWTVASKRAPTEAEWTGLEFAWRCAHHVTSNAIVLAHGTDLVGIGCGQQSRIASWELAIAQAASRDLAHGSVAASDAFLPFADNIDIASAAGITAIIHPGGSLRDSEVIEAANAANLALIATGTRHFRH